jgi:hypothetical protein
MFYKAKILESINAVLLCSGMALEKTQKKHKRSSKQCSSDLVDSGEMSPGPLFPLK